MTELQYRAKNGTDLLQVFNFTGLLQLVNKLQQTYKFYQVAISLFRAVARALIGGCIFIYSCYARLISFEINPNND